VKRRLFNLLAGVSLLLCVGAAAIWMRSHFETDAISWNDGTQGWEIVSEDGTLAYRVGDSKKTVPSGWTVRFGFASLPNGITISTMASHPTSPGWTFPFSQPMRVPTPSGMISPDVKVVQGAASI
jgi:hypothetical protein